MPDAGAPPGTTLSKQLIQPSSTFTTTSLTFVDVTGMSITMPNRPNGFAKISFVILWGESISGDDASYQILSGGSVVGPIMLVSASSNGSKIICTTLPITVPLNGQIVKLQGRVGVASTLTIYMQSVINSYIDSLEISSP